MKQKAQFSRLFAEVLPECAVEKDRIDEGVSVLYHTISGMMKREVSKKVGSTVP